jgi:hypothetical protein
MADFAIIEIFGSLSNNDFKYAYGPKLLNPAKEIINLFLPNSWRQGDLRTSIFGVDGRLIDQKNWGTTHEKIKWNHNLSRGIYVLRLQSGTQTTHLRLLVE